MIKERIPVGTRPYTRAITEANDTFYRLRGEIPIIREIGRTVFPNEWLPWLIENVGMGAVLPHVPPAAWLSVYQQRHWTHYRGTALAHETALGWIGFDATYRDGAPGTVYYDRFDLLLDRYPSHPELEHVVALAGLSKSTASIHRRVIYRHDVPHARYGHHRRGEALYGTDSGLWWRPDWPKLSLREIVGGRIARPAERTVGAGLTVHLGIHAEPERHIRYGHSRRGVDRPRVRGGFGLTVMLSIGGDLQDAPWSSLPWSDEPHGARPLAAAGVSGHVAPDPVIGTDTAPIRYGHARRGVDKPIEAP